MLDGCELWPGGPIYRQDPAAPLGTDSVLLADFVPLRGAERGIDLGCGAGILSLLLQSSSRLRIPAPAAALQQRKAAHDRAGAAGGGCGPGP